MSRFSSVRYGLGRRGAILGHWLGGRRNGEGLLRTLGECVGLPSSWKARLKIREIEKDGDFWVVHFRHHGGALHFPGEMDLRGLYQVIAELMYPRSWHYYEVAETRISRDDVVADCGAGEGLFSLLAAQRCRKVYAIEPLAAFVTAMRRTFGACTNVEVVPRALGEREGVAALGGAGLAWRLGADGGQSRPVEVTTLDAMFAARQEELSYLKADLEGSEMDVLRGGRETIRRFGPKIAITTYHQVDHVESIASFLRELDGRYRVRVKGIHHPTGAPVMLHAWIA